MEERTQTRRAFRKGSDAPPKRASRPITKPRTAETRTIAAPAKTSGGNPPKADNSAQFQRSDEEEEEEEAEDVEHGEAEEVDDGDIEDDNQNISQAKYTSQAQKTSATNVTTTNSTISTSNTNTATSIKTVNNTSQKSDDLTKKEGSNSPDSFAYGKPSPYSAPYAMPYPPPYPPPYFPPMPFPFPIPPPFAVNPDDSGTSDGTFPPNMPFLAPFPPEGFPLPSKENVPFMFGLPPFPSPFQGQPTSQQAQQIQQAASPATNPDTNGQKSLPKPQSASSSDKKTIWIGNIPKEANSADIENLCSSFGKCRVVKLQSPAHDSSIQFAIVVYEKEDDASKAVDKLDNKEFKNSVLKCCLKLPKGENQPPKQT